MIKLILPTYFLFLRMITQFKHLSTHFKKTKYLKNISSFHPKYHSLRFFCKQSNHSWIDECNVSEERKEMLRKLKSGNRIALSKMITLGT